MRGCFDFEIRGIMSGENMEQYQKKQIIIGSVYISLLLILATGAFLLLRGGESCFDGVLNQGEEGIDCGGPCAAECVVVGKSLQVLWARSFSSGDGIYDLAAKIQNPNPEVGAGSFDYEFNVYGTGGKIIATRTGSSHILPGESRYVVEPVLRLNEAPLRVSFLISNSEWAKSKLGVVELAVKNKDYKISPSGSITFSEASGTVVNKSDFDFDKTEVLVVLLDKRGNALAVNKTEIRALGAKEERFFKVSWFSPVGGEVAGYDMQATTNIFLSENILKVF